MAFYDLYGHHQVPVLYSVKWVRLATIVRGGRCQTRTLRLQDL